MIKKIWKKYGLIICVVCSLMVIFCYFFNIMFLQNKKDILNVLVLSSQLDVERMRDDIENVVDVSENEEIVIKYTDTINEANRAIVLTWIRAKTVDVIIGDKEQLDFFAANGCLQEMQQLEKEILEERYYKCCEINYDSEGNIIGREPEKNYGVFIFQLPGNEFIKEPVISFAINMKNQDCAMKIVDYYINRK